MPKTNTVTVVPGKVASKTPRKVNPKTDTKKSGRWHSVTVNGWHIVNRASKELAQHAADKVANIIDGAFLVVLRSPVDTMFEVWLTDSDSISAKHDVRIESYCTRGPAERYARKMSFALGIPVCTLHSSLECEKAVDKKKGKK